MRLDSARIVQAVIEKGWGEKQTCTIAGIGWTTWEKVKRGERVQLPSLRRLLIALDLEPSEVIKNGDSNAATFSQKAGA